MHTNIWSLFEWTERNFEKEQTKNIGIMYFIQDMAEEFIIRRNTHPLTQTQTQKARY